jgi:hypothetical protein
MKSDLFCGVCGYSNTSQPLLKCKSCNLRVHSDCIGGKNGIHSLCSSWKTNKKDSWECISCTLNQKDAVCCLCLIDENSNNENYKYDNCQSQLYLIPTSEEAWIWAHSCCINIEHNLVLNSTEKSSKPSCEFCKSTDYQLVTCSNNKDKKKSSFHISCAVLHGYDKGYNITRIGISNPYLSENDKEINDKGMKLTINFSSTISIDTNENNNNISSSNNNNNNFLIKDMRTKDKSNGDGNNKLNSSSSSIIKKDFIKYNFMHNFGSDPNRFINSSLAKIYGSVLLFNELNNLGNIIWNLTNYSSDETFDLIEAFDFFTDMNNIVIALVVEDENSNIKYLSQISSLTSLISKRVNNWETFLLVNKKDPLANKIKDLIVKNKKNIDKTLLNKAVGFLIAHKKLNTSSSAFPVLNNHLSRIKGFSTSKLRKITNDTKINNNIISETIINNNINNGNNNNNDDNIMNNSNDGDDIDSFLNTLSSDPEFKKKISKTSSINQDSTVISPRSSKTIESHQKSNKCSEDKYSFGGCKVSNCKYSHDVLNRNLDLRSKKEIINKELSGLGLDESSIDNIIENKSAEFEYAAVIRNRLTQIIYSKNKDSNFGEGIDESELADSYFSVYNEKVNYPILKESNWNCIITLEEILKYEKNVHFSSQINKYIYTGPTTWFSIPPEVPSKFKIPNKSFLDIIDKSTKNKDVELNWNNNDQTINFEEKNNINLKIDVIDNFGPLSYIQEVSTSLDINNNNDNNNVNNDDSSNSNSVGLSRQNSWMLYEDGTILPPFPSEENIPPPPPTAQEDLKNCNLDNKRSNNIVKAILFPCPGFNSHIGCTLGDKCNFSHDKPSISANNDDKNVSRSLSTTSTSSYNNNNNNNNKNNSLNSLPSKIAKKTTTNNSDNGIWGTASACGNNNNDKMKSISRSISNSVWGNNDKDTKNDITRSISDPICGSSTGWGGGEWNGEFTEWATSNISDKGNNNNNNKRKLNGGNSYEDDWVCPNTSCVNSKGKLCFSSKPNCNRCGELNPKFDNPPSKQMSKKSNKKLKKSSSPSHYLPKETNISQNCSFSEEINFTPKGIKMKSNKKKCRYGKLCHKTGCFFEH